MKEDRVRSRAYDESFRRENAYHFRQGVPGFPQVFQHIEKNHHVGAGATQRKDLEIPLDQARDAGLAREGVGTDVEAERLIATGPGFLNQIAEGASQIDQLSLRLDVANQVEPGAPVGDELRRSRSLDTHSKFRQNSRARRAGVTLLVDRSLARVGPPGGESERESLLILEGIPAQGVDFRIFCLSFKFQFDRVTEMQAGVLLEARKKLRLSKR